ncbi:MAG: acetate--CoA ligase family protein [Flavobacteriaceae bacterium]
MTARAGSRSVYSHEEMRRLVAPESVAIVGASPTPGSFGERTISNLAKFTGRLYGVNPKYTEAAGIPCFPTISDLPEVPDCVIIAVAAKFVEEQVREAAACGVGGVIVYASGFAELGTDEGKAAQARLTRIARETGIKIVGPNCVGLINLTNGAGLNFMPGYGKMDHIIGPVSIVSQSGGLGYGLVQGMERGMGFGHYLAAGNSCDVDVCDYISFLADEPGAKVIVCLFEGVVDGKRLIQAAQRAYDNGKPLIVYKMGSGEIGRKTAMSHTGTLVGSGDAYNAAFEKTGAIVIDRLEALLEVASFFARSGKPRNGTGVGIMATSGGAAVIAADKAEQFGVPLPQLARETADKLKQLVPGFGSVANPADLTAEVLKTKETFVACFDAFAADQSFDALVVPLGFASPESSGARTPLMSEMAKRTGLPIVGIWMSEWLEGPGSKVLDGDERATLFRSSDRCFETINLWLKWHGERDERMKRKGEARRSPKEAAATAAAILDGLEAGARSVDEIKGKEILAAYGIPTPREIIAPDAASAGRAAADIGFPVVIKIVSPDILHKTEVGGVKLNLRSVEEVRAATEDMLKSVARHKPGARIDGVVVQEMAPKGVELVVGAQVDPQFGPLVVVGLGGVLVELLRDTVSRLAPLTAPDVAGMLAGLKSSALLTGYRGSTPVDMEALVDLIVRFSEFVDDMGDRISEVDVNPVIALADRAICVDALIGVGGGEGH